MSDKVYWRELKKTDHVKYIGTHYNGHYETDSGAIIYWNGQEAEEAQEELDRRTGEVRA